MRSIYEATSVMITSVVTVTVTASGTGTTG
jgi:hypothetical protein